MKSLPVFNPQSRFVSTSLDYDDGEVPSVPLGGYTVYEDDTKNILASNDSPDVGFRWSVNPYRGCLHACAYCLAGSTPILMADGSTRALEDVRVGDAIYGTLLFRGVRRYAKTHVLAHWRTMKRAHRVRLADGTEIIASDDHRFLASRPSDGAPAEFMFVARRADGSSGRVLAVGDRLHGIGAFAPTLPQPIDDEYRRGYLEGWAASGVGFQVTLEMLRRIRVCLLAMQSTLGPYPRLVAKTIFGRSAARLGELNRQGAKNAIGSTERFGCAAPVRNEHHDPFHWRPWRLGGPSSAATRTGEEACADAITVAERPALVGQHAVDASASFRRGWLAAIFDAVAPGDLRGVLLSRRMMGSASLSRLAGDVSVHLEALGFEAEIERSTHGSSALVEPKALRIHGGLRQALRFLSVVSPCNGGKWSFAGVRVEAGPSLEVVAVEDLGFHTTMVDITTGTEDFIANGIVSHNCYARPSHEYLSFGAGTDFERKIVVKRRAPELLRDAFEKKSWKGELVVFSGITDCYQPLEREMKLTRGCLEVCAQYKNPVGVITKSPVIERDIDVLQELARVTSLRVSVSVPFWDPDAARAMEPMVTTPERRMKIIETLAKAGLKVGVSVSPIVPGLNDEHLGDVLERAADAGARHCFFVLLRLPGPVKDVFERALREKLPLRAEKVLRRMREAHGGKLYDSRFGQRQHGSGPYADTIAALFARTAKRYGLNSDEMDTYAMGSAEIPTFERPLKSKPGQTSFGF